MLHPALMFRIAPGVADETFRRGDLLFRHVGLKAEEHLLKSGTLIRCAAVRFYFFRLPFGELNRLVGFGEDDLLSTFAAKGEISTGGRSLSHHGAIARVSVLRVEDDWKVATPEQVGIDSAPL